MPPGSAPASGSVCANAVDFSPRKTGSRYFFFCSSESDSRMERTSGPKMPGPRAGSATVRASSSVMTAMPRRLRSWPPSSFGTLEQPESELARLGFQRLADLRLEIGPVHRLHLDRDQFPIDEAAHRVFQNANVRGQLEIHSSGFHHYL